MLTHSCLCSPFVPSLACLWRPYQALGIFGDGPEVSDDDIKTYGMKIKAPTDEEAAALGLFNSTIRLSADEAAALGLSGPVSLTPEEAEALGLSQASNGALITEDDMDKYGLRDPPGWNASGYSHLKQLSAQAALRLRSAEAARLKMRAHLAVQQLLEQKRRVAKSKAAVVPGKV